MDKKRYFEDLKNGEQLACGPVKMTREAILRFAKEYDPQVFHVDEEAAENSLFKGLVASSLHTLSACTRVVVEAQGNLAVVSGIGMHEVRMFNPVRPGDELQVNARWSDLKRSRSKPDRGFAAIRCEVVNQRQEPVINYGYKYLIACRTKGGLP